MNEKQIEIYQQPGIDKYESLNEFREKLQNFTRMLERPPKQDAIKTFSQGKTKFDYIPIDEIENLLNTYFFGLWNWVIEEVKIVGNEIVTRGTLEVFHPSAGIWIKRSGIGACQIRMKADSDIMDISNKIKNSLTMDAPHSNAEAFKNACLSLGRQFGRGLRRDFTAVYQGLNLEAKPKVNDETAEKLEQLEITINEYSNPEELIKDKESLIKGYDKSVQKLIIKMIQKRFDEIGGAK